MVLFLASAVYKWITRTDAYKETGSKGFQCVFKMRMPRDADLSLWQLCELWEVVVPVTLPLPMHLDLRAQSVGFDQSSLWEEPKAYLHLLVALSCLIAFLLVFCTTGVQLCKWMWKKERKKEKMAKMRLLCKCKDWIGSEVVSLLLVLRLCAGSVSPHLSKHCFSPWVSYCFEWHKGSKSCGGVPLHHAGDLACVLSSGCWG